jgi:hypothetical protein
MMNYCTFGEDFAIEGEFVKHFEGETSIELFFLESAAQVLVLLL